MATIPDMQQKISNFDQDLKNVLLKIYWPLEGLNYGQTSTMFTKTKNLVPLPSKNTTKNFLSENTKLTSAIKLFNFSIYLKLDTYSLLYQVKLLFAFLAY